MELVSTLNEGAAFNSLATPEFKMEQAKKCVCSTCGGRLCSGCERDFL